MKDDKLYPHSTIVQLRLHKVELIFQVPDNMRYITHIEIMYLLTVYIATVQDTRKLVSCDQLNDCVFGWWLNINSCTKAKSELLETLSNGGFIPCPCSIIFTNCSKDCSMLSSISSGTKHPEHLVFLDVNWQRIISVVFVICTVLL